MIRTLTLLILLLHECVAWAEPPNDENPLIKVGYFSIALIISIAMFRALTFEIWGKKRDTPKRNGAWVGAWFAAIS